MLKESMEIIINAYKSYQGTGMYLALFFISILYLYITEKDDNKKVFFVYYPFLALFIIINPIFYKLVEHGVEEDTYVRTFWILPMGISIAYASTKVITSMKNNFQKNIVMSIIIFIIIISGRCVYNTENFQKATNWYKLPEETKNVADYIINDNFENKKVICPQELVPYLRQIDARIHLYYGRRTTSQYDDIRLLGFLKNGDLENLTAMCKNKKIQCNYIIFKRDTLLNGNMSNYGYKLFAQTENYDLYKLNDENFGE